MMKMKRSYQVIFFIILKANNWYNLIKKCLDYIEYNKRNKRNSGAFYPLKLLFNSRKNQI